VQSSKYNPQMGSRDMYLYLNLLRKYSFFFHARWKKMLLPKAAMPMMRVRRSRKRGRGRTW
jgi:hypothetical protein